MTLYLRGRHSLDVIVGKASQLSKQLGQCRVCVVIFTAEAGVPGDQAHVAAISAHQKVLALRRVSAKVSITVLGASWAARLQELQSSDQFQFFIFQRPFPRELRQVPSELSNKDLDCVECHDRLPTASAACVRLAAYFLQQRSLNVAILGANGHIGRGVQLGLNRIGVLPILIEKDDPIERLETADLVISAVGHADLINSKHIRRGAIVLDAGFWSSTQYPWISKGDLAVEAHHKASVVTPVPGGIGVFQMATIIEELSSRLGARLKWTLSNQNFS